MLAVLLLALLPAQDPELDGCRRCDHRGVQDCEEHRGELLELEQGVLFCTDAAACQECAGALLLPCKRCDGGPETAIMNARRAAVAEWMGTSNPVSELLGRPVLSLETERFRLMFDVESLREGRKKVDGHTFMHRVARDLVQIDALVTEHYGCEPKNYAAKMRQWIWQDRDDHVAVMTKFLYNSSSADFTMLGRDPVGSLWTGDRVFQEDAARIHTFVVHQAAHMLISNLYLQRWIGDQGGGWLDAGASHWYEEKLFDRTINYCIDESTVPPNYHGGVWRAVLRRRLAKEDGRLLPALLRKQTGELAEDEHALAWSVYDWIVHTRPEALTPLLRGYKTKQVSRDLFKGHLGMTLFEAEDAWRAWVAETYPPKEPKRRTRR